MIRGHKSGMIRMIGITAAVILISIGIVKAAGIIMEKQLLSQTWALAEPMEAGEEYLTPDCPWEASADTLREAKESEITQLLESDYWDQLQRLAQLFDGAVSLEETALWIDEENRFLHKGSGAAELSYVVDPENGIVGFGVEAATETEDAAKEENRNELIVLLDDSMQELYRFLPAVNDIWAVLQLSQEQPSGSDYEYISGFPRQVLYYQGVLTVILEMDENDLVLQYDPGAQQYTACFLMAK